MAHTRAIVPLVCLILAACGGGGGGASSGGPATIVPVVRNGNAWPFRCVGPRIFNLPLSPLANYANPVLPAYYASAAAQDNTPPDNPTTNAGATLGRVLFNDPRLSINNGVSCSACHRALNGFTDPGVRLAPAWRDLRPHTRCAFGNVRYYHPGTMFWDKRAASVEAQAIVPMQNTVEMGLG